MWKCYPLLADPVAKGGKAQAVMVIFGVELQRVAKGWRGGGERRGSRDFSSSQREPLLFWEQCYFVQSLFPVLHLRYSEVPKQGGGISYINYVHIRGAKESKHIYSNKTINIIVRQANQISSVQGVNGIITTEMSLMEKKWCFLFP